MLRMGVEIRDLASPELARLGRALKNPGRSVLLPAARFGRTVLMRYYRALDTRKPNRLGGKRTHWWRRVATSVENPILRSEGEALIAITQPGLAMRADPQGGTVRSRRAGGSLAIPIHGESHGVWARDWNARHPDRPLFRLRSAKGNDLLMVKEGDGISPRYLLRKEARIPHDPEALPGDKDFGEPVRAYVRRRIAEVLRRGK